MIEPTIRAGETLMLPGEMSEAEALGYWRSPAHEVFVAEDGGKVVGTYYLRANQQGGGAHVANCGYATAPAAAGRGVARAMCPHSLERARARGFRAMQFNCVVASNERAVRLWQSCGFEIVGRVPRDFPPSARWAWSIRWSCIARSSAHSRQRRVARSRVSSPWSSNPLPTTTPRREVWSGAGMTPNTKQRREHRPDQLQIDERAHPRRLARGAAP